MEQIWFNNILIDGSEILLGEWRRLVFDLWLFVSIALNWDLDRTTEVAISMSSSFYSVRRMIFPVCIQIFEKLPVTSATSYHISSTSPSSMALAISEFKSIPLTTISLCGSPTRSIQPKKDLFHSENRVFSPNITVFS